MRRSRTTPYAKTAGHLALACALRVSNYFCLGEDFRAKTDCVERRDANSIVKVFRQPPSKVGWIYLVRFSNLNDSAPVSIM